MTIGTFRGMANYAPLAINVLNYFDRSNFDPKVIKKYILDGLDKNGYSTLEQIPNYTVELQNLVEEKW